MKKAPIVFSLFFVITASGRASPGEQKYVLPIGNVPTATVKFLKGNLRLSMMRGDAQYYGVVDGDVCKSSKKLIRYSGGIGGNTEEKLIRIEAGTKIQIMGNTVKQAYGGYQRELYSSCINIIEFTPIANRQYNISQMPDGGNPVASCQMDVRDVLMGSEPSDFRKIPVPSCKP